MAVTYGFYDSLNHDRLYNAQQMSAIFDGIINDGVFMSVGNQFHTVAGTGMQVIVKSGRAWFDSTWTLNDAEYPLSIDAADVLLTRIDAVVLEVNSEVATRANTIKVVKGTPASTPAKPTLTNTATIHQHALAYVTVAKNTTAITNSMIEIVVGKTETPYVTAILQTTDITDLYNQWEDYFQTWFDTVRSTLDGDVALNLQNQITTLRRETLKNTTPPIIGLSSSATPDDMFQALAKTGDLHVWRKTAVVGSYYIGATQGNYGCICRNTGSASFGIKIQYASEITVDSHENRNLVSPSDMTIIANNSGITSPSATSVTNALKGNFIRLAGIPDGYQNSELKYAVGSVFYCPESISCFVKDAFNDGNHYICLDGIKNVTTKTENVVTYPVSTNPNAYQEGSDAKPAGYVLGSKTETWAISSSVSTATARATLASSVSVGDDGTVSLVSPNTNTPVANETNSQYVSVARDYLRGSFLQRSDGTIWYIPSDANVTSTDSGVSEYGAPYNYCFVAEMQPVTGYPAIPARTTIEYLGKLGDKARMQVLSYIGTGTFGESNPNSLTFDFVPKIILLKERSGECFAPLINDAQYNLSISTSSSADILFCAWNNKTVSWYSSSMKSTQLNSSGKKYIAIAIG